MLPATLTLTALSMPLGTSTSSHPCIFGHHTGKGHHGCIGGSVWQAEKDTQQMMAGSLAVGQNPAATPRGCLDGALTDGKTEGAFGAAGAGKVCLA